VEAQFTNKMRFNKQNVKSQLASANSLGNTFFEFVMIGEKAMNIHPLASQSSHAESTLSEDHLAQIVAEGMGSSRSSPGSGRDLSTAATTAS
jgi:hypothetical protein